MTDKHSIVDEINAVLPQTQCGLCGYSGCYPYAVALANNEAAINRCPPGGRDTLKSLASILNEDPTPFLKDFVEKKPSVAIIDETRCIGCTKCIQACPTDAIIGASKLMHTVIQDACTGCDRCLPVCPVDCIDILLVNEPDPIEKKEKADHWRKRYEDRNARLLREQLEQQEKHHTLKSANDFLEPLTARKKAIADAVARVKARKKIDKTE